MSVALHRLRLKKQHRAIVGIILLSVLCRTAYTKLISGPAGLYQYLALTVKIAHNQKLIQNHTTTAKLIDKEIMAYQTNQFVLEKQTRLLLQMARPDELVFVYKNTNESDENHAIEKIFNKITNQF